MIEWKPSFACKNSKITTYNEHSDDDTMQVQWINVNQQINNGFDLNAIKCIEYVHNTM